MTYKSKKDKAVYERAYYAANREKILDRKRIADRRRRSANAQKYRDKNNRWRTSNLEKMREYDRDRYHTQRKVDPVYKEQVRLYNQQYLGQPEVKERKRTISREWARKDRIAKPDKRNEQERVRLQNPEYRARKRTRRKNWEATNPKWFNKYRLKYAYGITEEEYNAMLVAQGGVCYICKSPPNGRALCVDHNGETGAVRKLLCGACNAGIAMLKHNCDLLRAAIAYLEEHGGSPNEGAHARCGSDRRRARS
jgi:hypothetical protein